MSTERHVIGDARRAARIRRIVGQVMDQRESGRGLTDAQLIDAHPELMPELARELALLSVLERARTVAGASSRPSRDGPIEPLGEDAFEGYTVAREAHRGGQGVVYDAVQKSTGRRVAIKIMREGLFAGDRDAARFEREVRVLGQLEHPGIVSILGSGIRAGHFYYVMDFVQGTPLDEYTRAIGREPRAVLELIARVCDAINAAHLRGIIHRDLKPGNILVDSEGRPHVLDFGLARETSDQGQRLTMTGQFVGSVPWSSPEQAAGDHGKVDVRTDVYSLGVILYQALTGRFPYPVEGGPREVLNHILLTPPARPRSVAAAVDPGAESVVLKCLSKERERRYQSAGELAADIRRWLGGRPVLAHPPSPIYQLRTFARRNRVLVAATVLVLSALLLGLVGTSIGFFQASIGRRAAEERSAESRRQAYVASIAAADSALRAQDAATARAQLDNAPADLRGWEWSHLMRRADRSLLTLPVRPARDALASPDGASIALFGADNTLSLLDAGTFQPRWTVTVPIQNPNDSDWTGTVGCFSRDGSLVVLTYGPHAFVFDTRSGNAVAQFVVEGYWGHLGVSISPDNRRLAAALYGVLHVWDIASGASIPAPAFSAGADYSPDGRTLANLQTVHQGGPIELLDATTHALLRTIPIPAPNPEAEGGCLQFSPDGSELLMIWGFEILSIRVADGQVRHAYRGHTQRIQGFRFSPDGTRIASASWDRAVSVWDAASGERLCSLLGHSGEIITVSFVQGAFRVISSSGDGTVRLWEGQPGPEVLTLDHGTTVRRLEFSADGSRLASMSDLAPGLRMWRSAPWRPDPTPALDHVSGTPLDITPDLSLVLAAQPDSSIRALLCPDLQPRWAATGHAARVIAFAASRDGARIASRGADGRMLIWNTLDGRAALGPQAAPASTNAGIAFSPDGKRLYFTLFEPGVGVWDLNTATLSTSRDSELPASDDTLQIAISRDGATLASCHAGGLIVLWDARTLRPLRRLSGMNPAVWSAAFSPDGSRLAAGSQDRMARIWDTATGRELLVLRGHRGTVAAVAWSPDGHTLATGSFDRTIRIWEAGDQAAPVR